VKLAYGWNVTFVDGARLAMLRKPGVHHNREICYRFDGRRIKRIDPKTRTTQTDPYNRIPEDAHDQLVAMCRERWPAGSVTPKGGRS
jgi:hypothetical protein